jgi:pimeloyl-ACP methyl ester carboxylesterase
LYIHGLHVRTVGSGRPLILLHGLGSSQRIWDLLVPCLVPRHQLVLVDLRGHGHSHQPEDGYDFATICRDVLIVLDHLGLDAPGVVGHSWGAEVALEYAAGYPKRLSHLCLIDGGFLRFRSLPGMTWEILSEQLRPPTFDLPVFELVAMLKEDLGRHWRPEYADIMLGHLRVTRGRVRPRLPYAHHLAILRAMWEHDHFELFHRVEVPVMIVVADRPGPGALDWEALKATTLAEASRRMRDVRIVHLADTIHDIPLQRPIELAELIENLLAASP